MELCLTAIVRNEAPIIARMLGSVRPHISSYSISDTGSTDGTQDIVREMLRGVPGVLTEDKWIDFATNRNIALANAKGTHAITVDADEVLWRTGNGPLPDTERVSIKLNASGCEYWNPRIIQLNRGIEWRGVIHELPEKDGVTDGMSDMFEIQSVGDGNRSKDGNKLASMLALLEGAEQTSRTFFYRARTLFEMQRYEEAITFFEKHIESDAMPEEKYVSHVQRAAAFRELGRPSLSAMATAYEFRPQRPEALLALFYEVSEQIERFIPGHTDTLFLDRNAEREIKQLQQWKKYQKL